MLSEMEKRVLVTLSTGFAGAFLTVTLCVGLDVFVHRAGSDGQAGMLGFIAGIFFSIPVGLLCGARAYEVTGRRAREVEEAQEPREL
jgi:hypothetical protein